MSRPKVVKKQYPLDFIYILRYYIKDIDFYDYRSSLPRYPSDLGHLTVAIEEDDTKYPCLSCIGQRVNSGVVYSKMYNSLLLFFQKRKVFQYIIKECPKSDKLRVKYLVDDLVYA